MNFSKLGKTDSCSSLIVSDAKLRYKYNTHLCVSFTCRGCRSIYYFLMGFWLKSVQSLPGSFHHTRHVLPGWWFHEPPQQTGLPWQQLGSQLCFSPSTREEEQWHVRDYRQEDDRGDCLTENDSGVTFDSNVSKVKLRLWKEPKLVPLLGEIPPE